MDRHAGIRERAADEGLDVQEPPDLRGDLWDGPGVEPQDPPLEAEPLSPKVRRPGQGQRRLPDAPLQALQDRPSVGAAQRGAQVADRHPSSRKTGRAQGPRDGHRLVDPDGEGQLPRRGGGGQGGEGGRHQGGIEFGRGEGHLRPQGAVLPQGLSPASDAAPEDLAVADDVGGSPGGQPYVGGQVPDQPLPARGHLGQARRKITRDAARGVGGQVEPHLSPLAGQAGLGREEAADVLQRHPFGGAARGQARPRGPCPSPKVRRQGQGRVGGQAAECRVRHGQHPSGPAPGEAELEGDVPDARAFQGKHAAGLEIVHGPSDREAAVEPPRPAEVGTTGQELQKGAQGQGREVAAEIEGLLDASLEGALPLPYSDVAGDHLERREADDRVRLQRELPEGRAQDEAPLFREVQRDPIQGSPGGGDGGVPNRDAHREDMQGFRGGRPSAEPVRQAPKALHVGAQPLQLQGLRPGAPAQDGAPVRAHGEAPKLQQSSVARYERRPRHRVPSVEGPLQPLDAKGGHEAGADVPDDRQQQPAARRQPDEAGRRQKQKRE